MTFKNGAKLQKVQLAMLDQDVQDKFSGYDTSLAQNVSQLADISTNIKTWKTASNTWDDALSASFNYLRTLTTDSRGGKVYFPSGTYDLSPFTLPMRVGIEGAGMGITVLRMKTGSIGNFITVNSQSLFSFIQNVTIDGNKGNCPQGLANLVLPYYDYSTAPHNFNITFDKTKENADAYTYSRFHNIISANAKGNGIEINSSFWGTTFKNIFIDHCDGHGIYNVTTDIFFDTIQTESSGLCGIYEGGGNNRWSNIKTIFNGSIDPNNSAGMKIAAHRNLISNLEAQDNYCDGVSIVDCNSNQAYGVLVDGNGKIYGAAESTTGQMVGNVNFCGIRVKGCNNIKVRGIASNYRAPSSYFQNKAYIIEDTTNKSYNIDIDLFERYQYALSQPLTIPNDMYYSDLFLYKGTTPTWDTNGLSITTGTSVYFDKYSLKEQGIVEMIVNVSATNSSFVKFLAEKVFTPYNQFYIQRDVNKIDFSMPYVKQDGTVSVVVTNVDLGTFPMNTDIYIAVMWNKNVSDNSKGDVSINVKVNGTTYYATNTVTSMKSFITPKPCLGINHGSSGDLWSGLVKFLQISDSLPNKETFSSIYSIAKRPYRTGLYYDFQNYNPRIYNQVINYTDFTGETTLPPATSFYRNKLLYLQGALGVAEVDSLNVTTGATTTGNITITLNGVGATVAVAAGDSASVVASKINSASFTGWTTSLSGTTITFTKTTTGSVSAPTFADSGTTGTTATFTRTTTGVTATADTTNQCMKSSSDTYSWKQIIVG